MTDKKATSATKKASAAAAAKQPATAKAATAPPKAEVSLVIYRLFIE
jgi:hypothetical protein